MKTTEFLREFDQKDSGEYNDEAGMALSNLETICRSARELEKHIDTEENLPEWCQEKLAVVKGMLVAVTDYMVSQDSLDAKQDDFAFNTDRIAEQLNSMLEGGPYDLPGKDYDRPGDIKIKQRPHMAPQRPRHPDDPDFMDPDQRRLRAEQERLKKAAAEKHKGVAEANWNPVDHGDFPVNYDADTAQDAVGVDDASKWKAMTQYYSHHINVTRALDDLYRAIGRSYYDQGGRPVRFAAKMSHGYKDGSTETKYFDTKDAVYRYAQTYGRTVLSIEKVDTSDDDSGLIKLPVLLGVGTHKKKWILPFPDENYAQKWQFKHKNIADIQWPAGHALAESTGQDSKSWMASIEQQYPGVKFVQAKMMGAPIMALVNGKPVAQFDTKKGVAEAIPLGTLRSAGTRVKDEVSGRLKQNGPLGNDDMDNYRKDTANMAKDAIVNKMPLSKNTVNEFAGGMGAASVGSAPGIGKRPKVGSLFGGSYAPKTPFNKKRKR